MNYTEIRNGLLSLLGQASAFDLIDPLCADSVEMLQAAKETGQMMKASLTELIARMPKEEIHG